MTSTIQASQIVRIITPTAFSLALAGAAVPCLPGEDVLTRTTASPIVIHAEPVTGPAVESLSSLEKKVDAAYAALSVLLKQRSTVAAPADLEQRIAACFERLREQQVAHAERLAAASVARLAMPVHGGRDALARADRLLERHEGASPGHRPSGRDPA
jgi:hypothetical protein